MPSNGTGHVLRRGGAACGEESIGTKVNDERAGVRSPPARARRDSCPFCYICSTTRHGCRRRRDRREVADIASTCSTP